MECTVLCAHFCQPTFISCLSLLMCGFVCHGVEVICWSRYVLENLIGCPFVGKLPASFGTQRFSTIFIHKPNECTLKLFFFFKKKVLYCSCIAYYHVCIILPLAPMQPEGSSVISSISLLSSHLSPCLQTISFL